MSKCRLLHHGKRMFPAVIDRSASCHERTSANGNSYLGLAANLEAEIGKPF